jgi:hypothetical protein
MQRIYKVIVILRRIIILSNYFNYPYIIMLQKQQYDSLKIHNKILKL